MQKAESRLQRKLQQVIRREGGWCVKVHVGPFMPAGLPDLFACIDGIFIAAEVKTDSGKPSDIQEVTIEKIQKAGGIAGIVRNEEDILKLIRKARRLSERGSRTSRPAKA